MFKAIYSLVLTAGCFVACSQDASVQTLFGDGTRDVVDGVGIAAETYNPFVLLPTDQGIVLFDDHQDLRTVFVRTFDFADRKLITLTNTMIPSPATFARPTLKKGDYAWLPNGHNLWRYSFDPAKRTITYLSPISGYADGDLASAKAGILGGIVMMTNGDMILLDVGNRCFRKANYESYSVMTLCCNRTNAVKDGPADSCSITSSAREPALGGDGCIYFLDDAAFLTKLRRVNPDGSITTIRQLIQNNESGSGDGPIQSAYFSFTGIASMAGCPDGSIALIDGHRIRRISMDGIVSTVAGVYNGATTQKDGPAQSAVLVSPIHLVADAKGDLYFEDQVRIRKVTFAAEVYGPVMRGFITPSFSVNGTIGRTYRIEASESANGDWIDVGQMTLTKSPQTWFDENTTGDSHRFYRAILLP